MNIKIENTASAKEEAQNLINCENEFNSCINTLRYILQSFDSIWQGSAKDVESSKQSLRNIINYFETKISPALNKLGNGILAYATATEELANRGVGANYTPSQWYDENGPKFDQQRYEYLGGGNSLYDGSYTKEEFIEWVNNYGYNKLLKNGDYTIPGGGVISVQQGLEKNLLPYAETFYDMATERGLDPTFVFSIGCLESGYGTSWNAVNKGNLFGMGAFDSNPSNAYSYDNIPRAIEHVCDNLVNNYVTPGGKFYTGSDIGAIGKTYASSTSWSSNVISIMNSIRPSVLPL